MNKKNTVHLNVQTNCNLSFSLITLEKLFERALAMQLSSLAICDYKPHEFLKFYYLCKQYKIKPIWGLKRTVEFEGNQLLISFFPRNYLAVRKLNRFLFHESCELDVYLLAKLSSFCLLVLEARSELEFSRLETLLVAIKQQDVHVVNSENFYIGLNFPILNFSVRTAGRHLKNLIPFFAVKFLDENERSSLVILKQISLVSRFPLVDCTTDSIPYLERTALASYLEKITETNSESVIELFFNHLESFLAKIDISIEATSLHEGQNAFSQLTEKCNEGLKALAKSPKETARYQLILQEELAVVKKLCYSSYFLNLSEIVHNFNTAQIEVGPGRGSAVASLITYLLKLTQIDPVKHNLFFWRFLNEKRQDYPDVDIDVENQNAALDLIKAKHGTEFVAKIVVKKKLGWVNAIRASLESLPIESSDAVFIQENANKFINSSNDFKLNLLREKYSALFDFVTVASRLTVGLATHASGLIISDKRLADFIPIRNDDDYQVCLYQNEYLGNLGFRKYDFLSLTESLGFISHLKKKCQLAIPSYRDVDLKDEKTWKLLNDGLLTGIFQINTPSFARIITSFKPQQFFDLVLVISINRPGANQNLESIIARRENSIDTTTGVFVTGKMNQIVRQTFGHIIFEEQVTQIFAYCLTIDFSEGEVLRRRLKSLVSNKLQLEQFHNFFIENCSGELSFSEKEQIWEQLVASAPYLFNKAHAVSYAYLTYYTAYLKANFAPAAILYFLNKQKLDSSKLSSLLLEARLNNYELVLPEVNSLDTEWTLNEDSKKLFIGSSQLVTSHYQFFEILVRERKQNGNFENWQDMVTRTATYLVNVPACDLANWIELGVFDSLAYERNFLLDKLSFLHNYIQLKKAFPFSTEKDLPFLPRPDYTDEQVEPVSSYDNNKLEWETLNFYASYLARWKAKAAEQQAQFHILTELSGKLTFDPELLRVYVVITAIKRKKSGFWLTVYDCAYTREVFVCETIYRANYSRIVIHAELMLTIAFTRKEQDYYFPELVDVSEF